MTDNEEKKIDKMIETDIDYATEKAGEQDTDETIPIQCPECPGDFYVEGLEGMEMHIRECHPNYTREEALAAAILWMQEAYEKMDEFNAEYAEDRAREKRIRQHIDDL